VSKTASIMLLMAFVGSVLSVDSSRLSAADRWIYSGDALDIKEVKLTDSGEVEITFTTLIESAWYCPGANGKVGKEKKVLTFVRAWYSQRPKVDFPARLKDHQKKTLESVIRVDSKGQPIFVKSGKNLIKIYPAE